MNGPVEVDSACVTYGWPAGWSGCRSRCFWMSTPSRLSSLQLVTDHTSAATSHSAANISAARSAAGIATPEARILAVLVRFSGAGR